MSELDRTLSPQELHQSRVRQVIVCNAVLIGLATFGVGTRAFVRLRYMNGIGLDDAFCIVSWVFAFALCFTCAYMTKYGYGRHMQLFEHDLYRIKMFLKLDYSTMFTYLYALNTAKVSFCMLYLRIFPGNYFRWTCWILVVIVTAQCIEETLVVILQCSPVKKAWDGTGTVQGKCLDLTTFYYVSFAIKLITDIALFTLPIPKLWRIKLSWGKKGGVMFMFGLGLLCVLSAVGNLNPSTAPFHFSTRADELVENRVCVTSIIRATYLSDISLDHTWHLVPPLNWSSVEVCIAIFIACIPSLKALISIRLPFLGRMLGLSTDRGTSQPYTPERRYGTSGRRTGTSDDYLSPKRRHIRLQAFAPSHSRCETEVSTNTSQERIVGEGEETTDGNAIKVTTTTDVRFTDDNNERREYRYQEYDRIG